MLAVRRRTEMPLGAWVLVALLAVAVFVALDMAAGLIEAAPAHWPGLG